MGKVIEFIPANQAETLGALAVEPNLNFLKVFPRKGAVSRAAVVEAFHTAFQQIGGVSRLALWADTHPEEFFKLYARLLPPSSHPDLDSGAAGHRIVHVLPPTALDGVKSSPEGAPPRKDGDASSPVDRDPVAGELTGATEVPQHPSGEPRADT